MFVLNKYAHDEYIKNGWMRVYRIGDWGCIKGNSLFVEGWLEEDI
jgi:hypothetical protein